ncbi:MAG: hypothetical protein OXL40_14145 [Bacteroidota bacterium]|nr:hypothetical protein [Bacteroidota bacterium]
MLDDAAQDWSPEPDLCSSLPGGSVEAYHDLMLNFIRESLKLIADTFSRPEFDKMQPDYRRKLLLPQDLSVEDFVRQELVLMMYKARLHTGAVLAADSQQNIHSIAVQFRVVLECAANVVSFANMAAHGTPSEYKRQVNMREYEAWSAMTKLTGSTDLTAEMREALMEARMEVRYPSQKDPKRTTISDKMSQLVLGREWYAHLSERFCEGDESTVSQAPLYGGVVSKDSESLQFVRALFLDHLAHYLILMATGAGLILSRISDEAQLLELGLELLARKSQASVPMVFPAPAEGHT